MKIPARKFIFLLFAVIPAFSENAGHPEASLSGFITDAETGRPIPDANIWIEDLKTGAASGDGGFFCIKGLPPGDHTVLVRVIGFRAESRQLTVGADTREHFLLKPEPITVDPLLVTATLSDHLQSQVSAASEILTGPRLRETGGNTAAEIVQSARGLFLKSYDSVTGSQVPSIRGSNPEQVLVLLDGQPLNMVQGGGVDLNSIPAEALERVEIIRGGHSALYGTDAVGGVIQLITKDGAPLRGFSYGTSSTVGSFGLRNVHFHGVQRLGPFSLGMDYNRLHSDGNFSYDLSASGGGARRANNDYLGEQVFFRASWKPGQKNDIKFLAQVMKTGRGVAGSLSYPSAGARRDEDRRILSLQAENQISDIIRTRAQVFHQFYDQRYRDPAAWIPENDRHKTLQNGLHIQVQASLVRSLRLAAGTEIRADELNSTKFAIRKRDTRAMFIQSEWTLPEAITGAGMKWKCMPALRYDSYSDMGGKAFLKIGFLASAGRKWEWALKANAGRSFRVPSFNDLYWPEDAYTRGNPDLVPETSLNMDLGASCRRFRSSLLEMEATFFYNRFSNLIEWSPDAAGKYAPQNIGLAVVTGFEQAAGFRMPGAGYARISHTFMKALDKTPESKNLEHRLIYRPDHKWNLLLGLEWRGLFLNLDYRWVSRRFASRDNQKSLPAYSLLGGNLGASARLLGVRTELKLQVFNLLNRSVVLVDDYPSPGREFRLSLGLNY